MNLLVNKTFQKMYVLQLLGAVSSTIFTFILPLVLYEFTKSALAMSTMRMVDFLPNVLLGMLIGVYVDRLNRKLLMVYANIARVIGGVLFVYLLTMTDFALWHLYVLGFVLSSFSYAIGNASNAILTQLFDKSLMTDIQAKFSLIYTFTSIIGPALLGALLLWVSYEVFLWGYVACLACSAIVTLMLERVPTPERLVKQSIYHDLKEGVTSLFGNRAIFIPTWTIFLSNFASSLCIGVLTFYALDILEFTKEQLGLMFALSAFGGIVGAKVIKPLRAKWRRGAIYTYVPLLDMLAFLLFFFAGSWLTLGILLAIRTALSTVTNIIFLAIRQETTPNHLLGRVAGTSSMFMKLALPVGLFIGGIWADSLPVAPIFLLCAIIVSVNFFILYRNNFHEIS
ncbi:MAG: MFS transporter [Solibacillus sp.]